MTSRIQCTYVALPIHLRVYTIYDLTYTWSTVHLGIYILHVFLVFGGCQGNLTASQAQSIVVVKGGGH